ncbi:MAG: site-specific DNA-methyltransferase [Bacteroidaceae bacterium]|nr:site-specific DNA-methyltransferase [Bacteroidaceae bacterium]
MNKLKMQSHDVIGSNTQKIAQLFPDCVTERLGKDGKPELAIDFEKLQAELSNEIITEGEERYQFTWPDKRAAVRLANTPTTMTLRPCREESVDFDNTENLYIEGDNLEVLKLLRENYLGKVKMIYIDPPYNTGNDFVYNDDFAKSADEFNAQSGLFDEEGNRMADPMVQNTESNGRFHTDWLNMIYPRLKVAKDLLADDGVIFISIDENEIQNMRKIADEIFGEQNFISQLGWQKVYSPKNQARYFSNDYEFVLCYCRNINHFSVNTLPRTAEMNARYKNPDNDPRGDWKAGDCVGSGVRKNGYYDVVSPISGKVFNVPQGKHWVYAPENMKKMIEDNRIWFGKDGNSFPAVKQFLSDVSGRRPSSLLLYNDYGHTDMAKKDIIKLFPEYEKVPFDTPKPVKLIKMLGIIGTNEDDIILDFFAGSATTAQSVFELNVEQSSRRKFILVQINEKIENNPEALDKGLFTISDVAKERIRRAGKKIREELIVKRDNIKTELYNITGGAAFDSNPSSMSYFMTKADETKKNKATQLNKELIDLDSKIESFDTGFRVLKLDTSNMKDVYYTPAETPIQKTLGFEELVDNIKWNEGRTPEDLLFQVLPECNLPLSSKIEEREIHGKKVFVVEDGYLIACFDKDINESVITAIAKEKPYYFVMCDRSIATDNVADNFDQIFNAYSKETVRKIL